EDARAQAAALEELLVVDALLVQDEAAEKIGVVGGDGALVNIGLEVLDIGLHHWRVLLQLFAELGLLVEDFVHDRVFLRRGLVSRLGRRLLRIVLSAGGAGGEEGERENENERNPAHARAPVHHAVAVRTTGALRRSGTTAPRRRGR